MDVSTTVSPIFAGMIFPYAAVTAPPGYLVCDGNAVSRATYPILFAAIGITHGQGDGSTTFNVPDYRGRFLRGMDGSAGRDTDKAGRSAMGTGGATGNAVGSVQGHEFNSHTHSQNPHVHNLPTGLGGGGPSFTYGNTVNVGVDTQSTTATNNNSGGNETRPINANVQYLIKF